MAVGRAGQPLTAGARSRTMIPFHCGRCGHAVFFENVRCGRCDALLGYLPGERCMGAFEEAEAPAVLAAPPAPAPADTEGTEAPAPASSPAPAPTARWRRVGDACDGAGDQLFTPCANRVQHDICNWMLDPGDTGTLCRSCRLTAVIPDLTVAGNTARWAAIETAKRRLMFTLIEHGLDPEPKTSPTDNKGLALHLLAAVPGGAPVMTGHAGGTITINIAEADDVEREATRVAFGEPVRTLLGHLRHEFGHYLQQRWITGAAAETCRATFGDERDDYAAALARYHAEGPPADWQQRFVSAYASAHPFEDWAETCAHVLLVSDAVQTAESWGLRLDGPVARARPKSSRSQPMDRVVIEHWLPVAQFLNAMNRSLGLRDSYPYLMPDAVLQKMALVQRLLADAARRCKAAARRVRGQATRADAPPAEAAVVQPA
jgi:hypothetical protein